MSLCVLFVVASVIGAAAFQHRPSLAIKVPWEDFDGEPCPYDCTTPGVSLLGEEETQEITVRNAAHLQGKTLQAVTESFSEASAAAAKLRNLTSVKHTVMEIYAPWCPYCQMFTPFFDSVAKRATVLKGDHSVQLAVVNCRDAPQLCGALRVEHVPSVFAGETSEWMKFLSEGGHDSSKLTQYQGSLHVNSFLHWMDKQLHVNEN